MSEDTIKYMDEIPFTETCDSYCNYIEDYKKKIDELQNLVNELLEENEGYRQSNKRLMNFIEKYERGLE